MQRAPSRTPPVEVGRGHTRSLAGEARKRDKRTQKHVRDWDSNADYRMDCSRRGMIRDKYMAHIVGPWLAIIADDTPPDLPNVPLGIPSVARPPST